MSTTPGNPSLRQQGIDTRNTIVELVTQNVAEGGPGLSRAELAEHFGISKPNLRKHVLTLLEDGRINETPRKHLLVPAGVGHIHVCRTCGEAMGHS